jgi:hypothetical protein
MFTIAHVNALTAIQTAVLWATLTAMGIHGIHIMMGVTAAMHAAFALYEWAKAPRPKYPQPTYAEHAATLDHRGQLVCGCCGCRSANDLPWKRCPAHEAVDA